MNKNKTRSDEIKQIWQTRRISVPKFKIWNFFSSRFAHCWLSINVRYHRCCLSQEILGDLGGSARNRLVPHTFPTTAPRLSNLLVTLYGRCSKNDSFSPCIRAMSKWERWRAGIIERGVEARVYSFERDERARSCERRDWWRERFFRRSIFFSSLDLFL